MSPRRTRNRKRTTLADFAALTANKLHELAADLDDRIGDMLIDEEQINEESGFDKIAAWRALVAHLEDEALRR